MESFFDEVAPRWGTMRQTLFGDGLRAQVLARAQIRPGARALDVGAGTGFLAEGLLQLGAATAAIDASDGMVREMRAKFGARVDVRQGDGHAIPFPDASFDAVVANMFLHHAEDPALAIREMARVLAPCGRLVLSDMDQHAHAWLREEHHDRWMGFDREQVSGWMAAAGLQGASIDCADGGCCATSARGERAEVSVFIASGRTAPSAARPNTFMLPPK